MSQQQNDAKMLLLSGLLCTCVSNVFAQDTTSAQQLQLIRQAESARVAAIATVYGSVVAIYGENRKGGGSGVIVHPSGLALTNHHVVMGAGVTGWGGLADGKLYRWKLISTDPGGDVALIQLEGQKSFPYSTLGNSDHVRVGDWAMAMGNPFILAEDQKPTVTLGVVSGVERYQEGAGGGNALEYGNCIQVDSSINPGNSGGPLFNMSGDVIGINGRGSFEERGRVNVGLGYAISANQISNFVPDLMATKLARHGTLDAKFGLRTAGVVCDSLDLDSPIAKKGLELGDILVEFESRKISAANQFTNIVCTLPEGWPAEVTFQKPDGVQKTAWVRLYGLPYKTPSAPKAPKGKEGKEPTPQQKKQFENQQKMYRVLSCPPGEVRDKEINQNYCQQFLDQWTWAGRTSTDKLQTTLVINDDLFRDGKAVGTQSIAISPQGKFRVEFTDDQGSQRYGFDGDKFWRAQDGETKEIGRSLARANNSVLQAIFLTDRLQDKPFAQFNDIIIDGADKAQRQISFRVKATDRKADWLYAWYARNLFVKDSPPTLLKVANHLDSIDGAVNFLHWEEFEGVELPSQRDFVAGLEERVHLTAKIKSVTQVKDEGQEWFDFPSSLDAQLSTTSE